MDGTRFAGALLLLNPALRLPMAQHAALVIYQPSTLIVHFRATGASAWTIMNAPEAIRYVDKAHRRSDALE
jgi:hypothetical protein